MQTLFQALRSGWLRWMSPSSSRWVPVDTNPLRFADLFGGEGSVALLSAEIADPYAYGPVQPGGAYGRVRIPVFADITGQSPESDVNVDTFHVDIVPHLDGKTQSSAKLSPSPATSSPGSIPRLRESVTTLRRLILRSPRSTEPMYVRWRPHSWERLSCEYPASTRAARRRLPNSLSVRGCGSGTHQTSCNRDGAATVYK